MTSVRIQQIKAAKNCRRGYPHLFPTHSSGGKNSQFLQLYQKLRKEAEKQAVENCNPFQNYKKFYDSCHNWQLPNNQKNCQQSKAGFNRANAMIHKECQKETVEDKETVTNKITPSTKFDSSAQENSLRSNHDFLQYLFKMTEKRGFEKSNSLKSTDNQSESQLAKIKEENNFFMKLIQQNKSKATQLEQQIIQERKIHFIQKQIYQFNIERLLKNISESQQKDVLNQINQLHESFLSNNQSQLQEIDSLSIESN